MSASVRRRRHAGGRAVPRRARSRHEDVAPFLAAIRAGERRGGRRGDRARRRGAGGVRRVVLEVDGERVGTVTWERVNRRSRIASVSGFAIDPVHARHGASA